MPGPGRWVMKTGPRVRPLSRPGQQPGGAGVPVDGLQHEVLVGLAAAAGLGAGALGLDPCLAGGHLQVLDVEGEDFPGPSDRLIQESVEGFLPDADVAAGDQPVDRGPGASGGLAVGGGQPFGPGGHGGGGMAVLAAPGQPGRHARCWGWPQCRGRRRPRRGPSAPAQSAHDGHGVLLAADNRAASRTASGRSPQVVIGSATDNRALSVPGGSSLCGTSFKSSGRGSRHLQVARMLHVEP